MQVSYKGDNDYYIKHFIEEVLDKLDPEQVLKELEGFSGVSEDNIILLCYEKTGTFCHRHLVADWLNQNIKRDNYVFNVHELDLDSEVQLPNLGIFY